MLIGLGDVRKTSQGLCLSFPPASGWIGAPRREPQVKGCGGMSCHHWGALQGKPVWARQVPAALLSLLLQLSGIPPMLVLIHPLHWSQAALVGSAQAWLRRQSIGRGSPLGFCLTPGTQQGNPTGPKRKVAAVGLGEDQETPIFSLKMGNPGWGLGRGCAGRESCGYCHSALIAVYRAETPGLF